MTGNSLPRMRMNSALFPSSAITDAGTVAMATGMPVASVMSMANSPVQRSILSTMANSVRNDMSPLRNNIANPRQSTASLMPNNLSMNPMMSSTTASKDPFISTMSSIMSMLTNSLMAQSNNPMISSTSRRLMTSMTQPIATKTGNNNAMMGGAMTPAANSETTAALRFPSADEVLSSAMMEAVGQTRLASYPMSRFFGSSYF